MVVPAKKPSEDHFRYKRFRVSSFQVSPKKIDFRCFFFKKEEMANDDDKKQKTPPHFVAFCAMVVVTCIAFSCMVHFWRIFPFTEEFTWRPWNVNLYQGQEKPENFVRNGWTAMDPSVSREELAQRVGCSAAELFEGYDRPECFMKSNLLATEDGEKMWNAAGAALRQKNVGPFRVKSWGAILATASANLIDRAF